MDGSRQLRVLVVDDNRAELRLLSEAFRAAARDTNVLAAVNGADALNILQRTDAAKPDLVILDINMPGLSGHEVLRFIKANSILRSIVVFMFSSSSAEDDVVRAYDEHANGYLSKPGDLDEYFALARHMVDFWGRIAMLPANPSPVGGVTH
jgi:CheY-like chemotaxis protein